MRRGEHLEDRIPDFTETIEDYFGSISGTEERDGHELYVIESPDNPVFEKILVGKGKYSGKKDTLVVHFEERPAKEILDGGHADKAEEAVQLKNEFLIEATGRDAKSRRESLKREVENEPETPDNV